MKNLMKNSNEEEANATIECEWPSEDYVIYSTQIDMEGLNISIVEK